MAANTTTKVTPAETRVVVQLADGDSGSVGVRSFSTTFVSSDGGTIRNFVHGGAGYHLGGCLHETLTEHDGELRFGC